MIKVEDMNVVKCIHCESKEISIYKEAVHATEYHCRKCKKFFTKEYK